MRLGSTPHFCHYWNRNETSMILWVTLGTHFASFFPWCQTLRLSQRYNLQKEVLLCHRGIKNRILRMLKCREVANFQNYREAKDLKSHFLIKNEKCSSMVTPFSIQTWDTLCNVWFDQKMALCGSYWASV